MKTLLKIGIAILVVGLVSAAVVAGIIATSTKGSGNLKTEKRALTNFAGVEAGGAIEVSISASADYSVEVTADDNLIHDVETKVKDGVLKIKMDDDDHYMNATVRVKIGMPKIESLEIHGASDANVSDVKTDKLNIDVSGASKVTIAGTATNAKSEVSGASHLSAASLNVEDLNVECSGASRATVHANNSLDIEASGASNVTYTGTPKSLTKHTSGASDISGQ
jgi:hypothetical protein